jgi:hypothetical protein
MASSSPPPEPAASAGDALRAHWRAELERWSSVSAHLPLGTTGRLGGALALSRRGLRYLLRWYINPIVEQQNGFNAAAVSLDALDRARERELAREVDELRARVAALEERLDLTLPPPPPLSVTMEREGERPDR